MTSAQARHPRDHAGLWVTLRPLGRGNYKRLDLRLEGRHSPLPLDLRPGDRVSFGSLRYAVVSVLSLT